MFSPMFDGQYRSKPQVSLRGASRKEERGSLLARATEEREQRESSRRKLMAAITIQAFYRGHSERQQLYSRLREEFDKEMSNCSTPDHTLSLTRLMELFYTRSKDQERLVRLCQKWLLFNRDLVTATPTSPLCTYHLRQLLAHCCASLTFDPSQNIAIPLRMIETFLSSSSEVTGHLLSYLVRKGGYFRCLRTLMEHRTPPPVGPEDHAHFPLASSLLEYISWPLRTELVTDTPIYLSLAQELLAPPLTPHLCHILIPQLVRVGLSPRRLLETMLTALSSGLITPSLQLLYVVLQLVHPRLCSKSIDQTTLTLYLQLVALLLSHAHPGHVTYDAEEDDDIESMDVEELDPLGSQEELEMCCVSIITGNEVVMRMKKEGSLSADLISSLCSFCYQIILHQGSKSTLKTHLFQRLSLNPDLLAGMWNSVTTLTMTRSFGEPVSCLHQLSKGISLPPSLSSILIERLATFTTLFTLYLSTLHDAEFYSELEGSHTPFTLTQIAGMVPPLRDCFIILQLGKHQPSSYRGPRARPTKPSAEEWSHVKVCVHTVLCALYRRDCRRPFCPSGQWAVLPSLKHIPPELLLESEGEEEEGLVVHASPSVLKQVELLKKAPFVFPFIERVKFFTSLVTQDRGSSQGRHQEFLLGPSINLTVRRSHIYEDAFSKLAQGEDLRKKLRVSFVNAQGLDELGIDGGGLFREFLNEVLKTGFDPNRGYFSTTQDGLLYPNPQAPLISPDFAMHYRFLGAMLGKALYEGLLVELPFAGFFLCKLSDSGRGSIGTHHLASFDAELYRHLLSLKHYHGDMEELDLNFTLISDELGQSKVIELKPGGADIPVTRANCIEYIHLVSHYKLNVQLDRQFQAFRQGVSSVVPLHWLRLFSQNELQVLISGARVPINVEDLRRHTVYSGEYKEDHPVIKLFWEVVSSFSETEKRQLLKFITSCSRPPLLGFKELSPPLNISPGVGEERLPTASTCMNFLKLPPFQNAATLKEKLLYAIESDAGFELS